MRLKAIFLAIALNLFSVTAALALLPQARSEEASNSCKVAIANARKRITEGRKITIVSADIVDRSQTYPDHPDGRPLIVEIILVDSNAANAVMRSPMLQKAITSEVIKSCKSVGGVIFGIYQTGGSSTLGLMSDGSIQSFKCVEPGSTENRIPWGHEFCD